MAKSATINMRIEPDVKEEAEKIFNTLGITTTDAINMFLHQVINYRGIPFELRMPPNQETIEAIEEAEQLLNDPNAKTYATPQELFDELNKELESDV